MGAQGGQHLHLLGAVALGHLGGQRVAELERDLLEDVVGGDLEGFGRALVHGVAQQLLLAAAPAQHVERRLGQREDLPEHALYGAHAGADEAPRHAEIGDPASQPVGLALGLAEVSFEQAAVAAARRHGDVPAQGADEGELGRQRLVQMMDERVFATAQAWSRLGESRLPTPARDKTAVTAGSTPLRGGLVDPLARDVTVLLGDDGDVVAAACRERRAGGDSGSRRAG